MPRPLSWPWQSRRLMAGPSRVVSPGLALFRAGSFKLLYRRNARWKRPQDFLHLGLVKWSFEVRHQLGCFGGEVPVIGLRELNQTVPDNVSGIADAAGVSAVQPEFED